MRPTDAGGMANSVDPDQSSLIWVYTVCLDLPIRKLKIFTVKDNFQQFWGSLESSHLSTHTIMFLRRLDRSTLLGQF